METAARSTASWRKARALSLGASFLGAEGVVLQLEKNDCGPATLCNLLGCLQIPYWRAWVYGLLPRKANGVTMLNLKLAAERMGVSLTGRRLDSSNLRSLPVPLIAAVREHHFVVITRVDGWGSLEVADPAIGLIRITFDNFCRIWRGECLLVEGVERRAAA